MIDWLFALIPYFKALHIGTLAIWCAGLFALPLVLARHETAVGQQDYARIRRASHYGYTLIVTPAAVIAIASGTVLIFLREVFVLWMFAKLVAVAALVLFHAWVGHVIVKVAETEGTHIPPEPVWPLVVLVTPIVVILFLVLGKPDLGGIPIPDWLLEPQDRQFLFEVPR
jgi:protoporphyrinogen IX oxidase